MNDHQYSNLYIRENINSYVKYIKIINTIIDKSMPNSNIADIINNYKIETSQIKPIIYSLLVDKWKYKVRSINLLEKINNPLYLIKEVSRWNNVDIVIKYESLQVLVFNPKNLDSKSILEIMQPNELVTVYIGNKNNISEELISRNLDTADIPDPDLMIRTSGEQRISNYLIWQLAYAEYFFTDTLWPDFNKKDLEEAIVFYRSRDRRFGGIEKG